MTNKLFTFLLAGIFIASAALSWGDVEPLVKQTQNGIAFITGGVGTDERSELKKVFSEYTLRLELANKKGEYLSRGQVSVVDSAGKEVLQTRVCGPWLLVNLADGQYKVTVTQKDAKKDATITIEHGKAKLIVIRF